MLGNVLFRSLTIAGCALAMMVSGTSFVSGDIWFEVGDAPDGVPGRQDTIGTPNDPTLTNIIGFTSSAAGDFRDSYSIVIDDPAAFYATTSPAFGFGTGTADFDTRLLLWEVSGSGVMANDDIAPGGSPFLSLVSAPGIYPGVVDPGIPTLVAGQKYILTITGFNDNAFDAGGADIFTMGADFDALHAPLGGPFASWAPGGATGNYVIELGGVSFCAIIPEPATGGFLGLGLVGLFFARKRRKA